MKQSELQEIWDKMTLDLVESGRLGKRKGLQEDSAGDTKETTTDSKTTKAGMDIGVIFSRGRERKQENKGE